MPGELVIDPRLDAVFRIGAAIEVLRVQRLAFGVGDEIVEQQLEFVGRQTAVLLPPHRLVGRVVDDDELVLGTAAGVHAGFGAERPAMDECGLRHWRWRVRPGPCRAHSNEPRQGLSSRIFQRHARRSADPFPSRLPPHHARPARRERLTLPGRRGNDRTTRPAIARGARPIIGILSFAKALLLNCVLDCRRHIAVQQKAAQQRGATNKQALPLDRAPTRNPPKSRNPAAGNLAGGLRGCRAAFAKSTHDGAQIVGTGDALRERQPRSVASPQARSRPSGSSPVNRQAPSSAPRSLTA